MCRWCGQGPPYQVGPVSHNKSDRTSVPGPESSYQKAGTNINICNMKRFINFIITFMSLNSTTVWPLKIN